MSKKLSETEFDKLRASWIRAFQPVGSTQRCGWEADWRNELNELVYFRLTHFNAGGGLKSLIEMKGKVNTGKRSLEFMKMDLERIWSRIAAGTQAFHTIIPVESGFTLAFGGLNCDDNYVSGALTVEAVN
ncbi:MAG TPA: hypothetical protein VM328_12875 [Fimbriimonadaceae bacterium]|nr:hypothetical protein [Fimbriimonadaceae bacterium]